MEGKNSGVEWNGKKYTRMGRSTIDGGEAPGGMSASESRG